MNSNFYIINSFLLDAKSFLGADKKKRHKILNKFLIGMRNNTSIFDNYVSFLFLNYFLSFFDKVCKKRGKILFIGSDLFLNKKVYSLLRKQNFSYIRENSLFFIFLSQNINFFKIRLSIFKKYKNFNENFLLKRENFINSLEHVFSSYEKPFIIIFLDVSLDNVFLRDFKRLNIPIISFISSNKGFNLGLVDYYIPLNITLKNFIKLTKLKNN